MDRHRAYRQITRAVIGEYQDRVASLTTLPERIATERARLTAIRSSAAESQMQPSGAGNVRQERDTAILCEIDRLTAVLEETRREVDLVRHCLAGLDERQLRTLEVMDMQPRYRARNTANGAMPTASICTTTWMILSMCASATWPANPFPPKKPGRT